MNWLQIFPESLRAELYNDNFVKQLPGDDPFEFLKQAWVRSGNRDVVTKASLADYKVRMDVISTRLRAGETVIHVVADAPPEPGFEPVDGELEDLYFATLSSTRRASVAQA